MARQTYYPTRIGDQIVWLRNLKTKLPTYVAALGLAAGDVTAFLLAVDNAIYALDDYRGAVATFPDAAYRRIEDALNNETMEEAIVWLDFTLPPAPDAVPYGCLARIFAYINDTIRKSAGYDTAIGEDLGLVPPATPAPPPGATVPEFTLRTTAGGKLEVVWTKGQFDGVKLQFDLGAAGMQNDIDLRPNYTLNWLPAAGTSAIIKVRVLYILKGEDFGTWSPWQQWTLTGV